MSDLKTQVEGEARNREKYRNVLLVSLGIGALVLFAFFLNAYPIKRDVVKKEEAPAPVVDSYQGVTLTAKAAIVYDLATGHILFEKNAEAQLPLASLTKLLTLYAAVDTLSPDSTVTITDTALAQDGDTGFVVGDAFRFSDLARLTLVASSNDGAEAIAEAASTTHALSGKELLASAVQAVGLTQTYALNGTGLDESLNVSGGYGSAHDVALLAGALIKKAPDIARATTESSVSVPSTTGKIYTQKNTNPEVPSVPGALLSKTGFTDLAGGNLAIVFDVGIGHPVAIVALGSTRDGRFADVDALLKRTLDKFSTTP